MGPEVDAAFLVIDQRLSIMENLEGAKLDSGWDGEGQVVKWNSVNTSL